MLSLRFVIVVLTFPLLSMSAHAALCNAMGVTRNPDGSYNFARLITNERGSVVDSQNPDCVVKLLGFNFGWADSDHVEGLQEERLVAWKQILPWNLDRLTINARWWRDNVAVPTYGNAPFRDVLGALIQQNKKNGIYTEINIDAQFPNPPCVKGGKCASQNQAAKEYDNNCQPYIQAGKPLDCMPWATYLNMYVPPDGSPSMAKLALADLARIYGDDPSVIFDIFNEWGDHDKIVSNKDIYFKEMNERIALVHSIAPQALVIVYASYFKDIKRGGHAFPRHNIVIDYHVYKDRFDGAKFVQNNLTFDQAHGWGAIVNEYGGSSGSLINPSVLAELYFVAKSGGVGLVEWAPNKLLENRKPPFVLNDMGRMVCAAYSKLFNMATQSCGPFPKDFPDAVPQAGGAPPLPDWFSTPR